MQKKPELNVPRFELSQLQKEFDVHKKSVLNLLTEAFNETNALTVLNVFDREQAKAIQKNIFGYVQVVRLFIEHIEFINSFMKHHKGANIFLKALIYEADSQTELMIDALKSEQKRLFESIKSYTKPQTIFDNIKKGVEQSVYLLKSYQQLMKAYKKLCGDQNMN